MPVVEETVVARGETNHSPFPNYDQLEYELYDQTVASAAEQERELDEVMSIGLTCAGFCKDDTFGGLSLNREPFRAQLEAAGLLEHEPVITEIIRSKEDVQKAIELEIGNAVTVEATADVVEQLTKTYFYIGLALLEPSNADALREAFPYDMKEFTLKEAHDVLVQYAVLARAISRAYHTYVGEVEKMDRFAQSRVPPVVAD